MKLNGKELIKIVRSVIKESYGDFGPEEPTERMPHTTMNKEKFVRTQYINWVEEFNSGNPEELVKIVEVLEDAYEEIAHALELDNTGLYEARGSGYGSYKKRPRPSRDLISYARNLLLYNPNEPGGMSAHPIRKEQDGEYMRFIINKDGQDIEVFVNHSGGKVYRMGKSIDTGEQVDLIPDDTSGNMKFGGRGHISLKP